MFDRMNVRNLLALVVIAWAVTEGTGQMLVASNVAKPAPDGTIFCEAEEFTPEVGEWKRQAWGENYYAATFANTFLSRKAFLGAPAICDESIATREIEVGEAGDYAVLARYEAAYRFETQFKVRVEQGGKVLLDRMYGGRENVKIWAFSKKLDTEVAWPWGAVENVVWEGHDAIVHLQPGRAKISLIADEQPGLAAKRNVDLIMLTRDHEQVAERIAKERYLPLDGWLTQAGDVFVKVRNAGDSVARVTVGKVQEHSPYWVHIRNWEPVTLDVQPGATTEWVEVGSLLDSLNDAQWPIKVSTTCDITFGLRDSNNQIESIRTLKDVSGELEIIALADLRYSREIRTVEEGKADLVAYIKGLNLPGNPPKQTLIFAYTKIDAFAELFGLVALGNKTQNVYVDWRGNNAAQLEEKCLELSPEARNAIRVVSLGDEIGLARPSGPTASDEFVAFLKANNVSPSDLDASFGDDWSKVRYVPGAIDRQKQPGLYYWATRFLHHFGITSQKQLTDALRKHMPNAHIGANYSPHHGGYRHSYLGQVHQWVTCFRKDGMTLPWSEDYIWQLPVGSQQMNGINLDLFRAGNRGKPDREILYYAMPHYPGNTPTSWRRMFHNAVGHGMTIVNLFEFHPVWMAYTENHVTSRAMYAEVLRAFREMALYEDIMQSGRVRPSTVGLWFSETGDIWSDNDGSFAANKRALYTAIIHQQASVDVVVADDAASGALDQYRVLFLADRHVSQEASNHIADWVDSGGVLFATAGAGMFDEYDRPNVTLRKLLGVSHVAMTEPDESVVHFIKQDLPFARQITRVTLDGRETPVFGAISSINTTDAELLATFADGAPAVTSRASGKGHAIYAAFLPGLSYYKPAIPMQPVDRGSTDDAMAHFVPFEFDKNIDALIGRPIELAEVDRPTSSDHPLVEMSVVDAPAGRIYVVNNFSGKPIADFTMKVHDSMPGDSVTLASGGAIRRDGGTITFDLDVAEVVICR